MRIILSNPSWHWKGRSGVRAGSRWAFSCEEIVGKPDPRGRYLPFPFDLSYTAPLLIESGYDVLVIDAIAENLSHEEFIKRIADFQPDVVLMEDSTPSYYNDLSVARMIKNEIDTKIVFTGPHVTALPKDAIQNKQIDYVVPGEYVFAFKEFLDDFNKYKNKRLVLPRPKLHDFNEFPMPARELFPMDAYNDAFAQYPQVQMLASRGCLFSCIFCLEPNVLTGPNFRPRKPELVIEEMKDVEDKYKPKEIYFDDSTFTTKPAHTVELCDALIKAKIKTPLSCMTSATCVPSKEFLTKMRKAGFIKIKLGMESANQQIINNTRKPLNVNHLSNVLGWCRKVGIGVHLTTTFGLPGETRETIKETQNFVSNLLNKGLINTFQFSHVTPFPGTPLFFMAEKNGWLRTKEWDKYDGSFGSVLTYPNLPHEEIEKAVKDTEQLKYTITPGYVLFRIKKAYQMFGPINGTKYLIQRYFEKVILHR
jgi:radical SAM superfamily enzyme YgiQ (UPF0313 family)